MAVARPFESLGGRLNGTLEEARAVRGEFGDVANDLRELARAEVRLVAAEAREQGQFAARAAVFGGTGLTFLHLALAFGALTGVIALDMVMPLWASALIVTGVLLAVAVISSLMARAQAKKLSPIPHRTISSLQEDMAWAKSQMKLRGR